jgi:hypothetical protein
VTPLAAFALVAALGDEIETHARHGAVEVAWTAPDGCPTADDVLGATLVLLGGSTGPSAVQAVGVVEQRNGAPYVLELRVATGGQPGTRRVEAKRCERLADVAALVLAIAIDPSVLARAPSETPPETQAPAPVAATPIVPEPSTTPPPVQPTPSERPKTSPRPTETPPTKPTARRRVHVGLVASGGVGLALLPGTAAALGLATVISGRLWRVEIGALYWSPRRATSSANPDVGGRFQLGGGDLRACVVPGSGTIELPICAGLLVAAMHGRGSGRALVTTNSVASPLVAATAGPVVLWRPRAAKGVLGVLARIEGILALTRPAFQTAVSGSVHEVPRGGAQALVGLEVRFR